MPKNVMVIYGTRPEAIKLAPVIRGLQEHKDVRPTLVSTGQHREMLAQVNEIFGLVPDHDLDAFAAGQTLNALSAKIFARLDPVLESARPDAVLVQGDTTTVAAAALAAFYRRVPVIHLEAGLRSGDLYSPFPEEANRKVTSQLAALHLAPTPQSRANLLHEGVDPDAVVVTGNTVIDALLHTRAQSIPPANARLREAVVQGRPIILVTAHRRENWGEALTDVGRALARLAARYPEHLIVLPAHRNPHVREAVLPHVSGLDNVLVSEPLAYGEFTTVMNAAQIVLTDSGGVQEEAPSLGKPVLVMRENTERPEGVEAGTVRLVGTAEDRLVTEVSALLDSPALYEQMAHAANPYGDGRAAERAVAAIAELLGVGQRMSDFHPVASRPADSLRSASL
ncbi:non-hydrolyzing UDP-N-acetylglucosamine 2-epimerase [Actinomyces sp. MRS3W]|uniref:non-hydrolyzing UDP-N-acetylglucosamine 2-epimerase n=1 Tax=Actinomyces sp. MRS3W TaxID=2800796 RepID=UPI0028FD6906|nr:UDP-N-acetylglucosamine 2-epimerase (non-hydrolyzing) [Actinomyces sp. MRS3W]MDU0347384.1 UDP-N-acetylglucosamine 2-epimerase (non-hydrolyzing) [Actinomyces sp. MRS3W]